MILTVTLNMALDVTYAIERIGWGESNRVASVSRRAGGKGINVSRVLHRMAYETLAMGLIGGATGAAIDEDLRRTSLAARLVRISGESRQTVAIVDPERTTLFNEPGPEITGAEWDSFVTAFRDVVGTSRCVVLSGSLPPGAPVDGYATLLGIARGAGVPSLLDTSGPALEQGVTARPDVVKPNHSEVQELLRRDCRTAAEAGEAANELRHMGAGSAVVTRGAEGLVAATEDATWTGSMPEVIAGNPTGAGDAVAAALAIGVVEGRPWPDRLADALAFGAASLRAATAGDVDPDEVRRLRVLAKVAEI